MLEHVTRAYRQVDDARPFVRPSYNDHEVLIFPPYGDPEVHIPSEIGTYFITGILVNAVLEQLNEE